jgi:D-alanyl-D-alanine endopeptidase (penicillin-binding protein 7)
VRFSWSAVLLVTTLVFNSLLSAHSYAADAAANSAQAGKSKASKNGKSTQSSKNKAVPRSASTQTKRAPVSKASRKQTTSRQTAASQPKRQTIGRMSIGQMIGLHKVDDPLDLRSSVALVVDQQSGAAVFSKNPEAVLPIASITKLMTAMVVLDAQLPLDESIEITRAEIDTEKHTRSRLAIGMRFTRAELLHLALMASENRAAHALGRSYPGGLAAFLQAMNDKARALGMNSTNFSDPTGLSSRNVSNAVDLARMVSAAFDYPLIKMYSTAPDLTVRSGKRNIAYSNTNRLVKSSTWDISLQKTGYISEAGSCLVMYLQLDDRPTVLVLLDAVGIQSRFGDAGRIRKWLEGPGRIAPLRTTDSSYSLRGS